MTFDPARHTRWHRCTVTWFASVYVDEDADAVDYEVSRDFVCDLAEAMRIAEHGYDEHAPAKVKGASVDRVTLTVHGDFPDPDVPGLASYNRTTAVLADLASGYPDAAWEWSDDPAATLRLANVEKPRKAPAPVGETEVAKA